MAIQQQQTGGDLTLLQAIEMVAKDKGIDKTRLVNDLTYGASTVASGDLPDFLWAADPSLRNLPYDPAAARRALAALGYTPAKPLALDLVFEQTQAVNRALGVQLQAALQAVGVIVHTRTQLCLLYTSLCVPSP